MTDDRIPWEGPRCRICGHELDIEVVDVGERVTVAYICPEHGAAALADPFR